MSCSRLSTSTFLELDNLSLVVEQSLVVGTLALGQTLVILTAGIDLANAAIMVLGHAADGEAGRRRSAGLGWR